MPDALRWMTDEEFREKLAKAIRPVNVGVRKAVVSEVTVPEGSAVEDGPGPRTIKFTLSDGSVDRDKDVVSPKGWDLDNYRKNPTFLWAHDYKELPLGKALSIGVEGDRLVATAEFTPKDLNPMGDTVYRMLKGGWLNAVSVGFKPKDFDYNTERKGVDYHRQELLEVSVVPIPSNAGALQEAKGAGVDVAPVRLWAVKWLLADQQKAGGMPTCPECGAKSSGAYCPSCGADMGTAKAAGGVHPPPSKPTRLHEDGTGDPFRDNAGCPNGALCPKLEGIGCPLAEGCPAGKAIRDAVGKRGRMVSAKNEAELRAAVASINTILDKLTPAEQAEVLDDVGEAEEEVGEVEEKLAPALVAKHIVERDGEWCVTTADGSKTLGCHPTKHEAVAQLAAVEANKGALLLDLALKALEDEVQFGFEVPPAEASTVQTDDEFDIGDMSAEEVAAVIKDVLTASIAHASQPSRSASGRVD